MTVRLKRHLITVERYDQMIAAGIFTEDERLELLGGEIIEMGAIGIPHAACVKRLNNFFTLKVGDRAIIGVQDPIHVDRHSEPQPDIVLLQRRDDFYAGGHPEPEDILLLIEVADASLLYDRLKKLPRYARAGIEEVWIVNLNNREVEVYRRPSPDGYLDSFHVQANQTLAPLAFPELQLTANLIFG
jgi:Uma2 family endonuclease